MAVTKPIALDETLQAVNTTLQGIKTGIEERNTAFSTHAENKENPHEVTKAQVGLGNVLNVAQYSKDEVDASLLLKADKADTYTKDEVDSKESALNTTITNHVEDVTNPHSVTKAQVGLGNVRNVEQYSKDEVDTKLATKSDSTHNHDSRYYTETEVDTKFSDAETKLKNNVTITVDTDNNRQYNMAIYGTQVATFTVPPDKFIESVSYDADTDTMTFVFNKGDGTTETIDVDISDLVDTYTAGNGLNVASNQFSLKLKTGESVLKVDATGLSADTYTKTQIDSKDALKANSADVYTQAEIDASLLLKADKSTTYTKTEVDDLKTETDNTISTHKADTSNPHKVTKAQVGLDKVLNVASYSKDEVDTKLATKSDSTHTHDDRYYTETEIDTKVSTLNTEIGKKQTAALVTAFQSSPDDTHYPSEKLVKAQLDTKADKTDYLEHKADTDNPHNVTKAQVGLGNVLNVASYSKTEMDITVSSLNTAIGKKQNTANLVTEWQTTPDDTHYPSEKLVKDSIDEASSSVTTHANRADNPHSVTKEQVGLGNVLNVAQYSKTEVDTKLSGKSDTSHTHDDRYYTESEIDSKVTTINTELGKKQLTSNLVTAFQTTPDDTHYPSEKLVKTNLNSLSTTITNHTNNKSNPHGVTKAQVGLGNVLNVAAYSKTEIDDKIEAINTAIASMQTDLGLSVNDDGVLCVTYETV